MNREEKKRATRQKIMDTAMELFAEQGYEATTVHQITERAGVAKGTFFNYFQCKEDVLCDLQTFWVTEEVSKLQDKSGPLIPQLREFLLEMIRRFPYTRPFMMAMFQGIFSNGRALGNQTEHIEVLKKILIPVIEEGQRRGEFTKSMPADMIVDMAIQTYFGVFVLWGMGFGDEKLNTQMALSFELFFRGIQA
jgi:AcrR family transcriptional regulator